MLVKPLNRSLGFHLAVSIELSLKLSLTIGDASARGIISSVQINATTMRENVITMRVLVVIVCEVKTRPCGPDIEPPCGDNSFWLMRGVSSS